MGRALRRSRSTPAAIPLSIPWGLTVGPPPPYIPLRKRFYQEVLEPISFERNGPEAAEDPDWLEACHERVVSAMQAGMDRLVEKRERDSRS